METPNGNLGSGVPSYTRNVAIIATSDATDMAHAAISHHQDDKNPSRLVRRLVFGICRFDVEEEVADAEEFDEGTAFRGMLNLRGLAWLG